MRKSFAAQRRVGLELNGIEDEDVPPATDKSHVASLGGISIFCFRLARLFACLALFCISVVTITRDAHWKEDISRKENLLRVGLTGTYVSFLDFSTSEASDCCIHLKVYATILAVGSVAAEASRARRSIRHLCFILTAVVFTLGYRDLWPLATFTLSPIDADGTPLLWIEVGVLTFAAVIVPLLVPRQYIPHDPKVCSHYS